VLCYEAGDRRASPNLMGVSWREHVAEQQKRLTQVERYRANNPAREVVEAPPRSEAAERAALRAEYFRKSSARRVKAHPYQKRLIDAQ